METIINAFISRELVTKPDLLPLQNDSPLLEYGILDSLSLLRLVLFLEEEFGITVDAGDMVPENFETIEAICAYLRTRQGVQQV